MASTSKPTADLVENADLAWSGFPITTTENSCQVRLPCNLEDWPKIQQILHDAKSSIGHGSQEGVFLKLQSAVCHVKPRHVMKPHMFDGLCKFLEFNATQNERQVFWGKTLPFIIDAVLRVEYTKPARGLVYSKKWTDEIQHLPPEFITSLVACAFLCLLPEHPADICSEFNINTYEHFFQLLSCEHQCEKLRMVLHFFERLAAASWPQASGIHADNAITFRRLVLPSALTLDQWTQTTALLCNFEVSGGGRLVEDFGNCLQVDFANEFIGGGVLQAGNVQEEIMFCASPQLQASMFFMPRMLANEAIQISGFEPFSRYSGYGGTLKFTGDVVSASKFHLTAIDATWFGSNNTLQYEDRFILRDLNKAYIGFHQMGDHTEDSKVAEGGYSQKLPIATGNWGCGIFNGDPQLKSLLQWIAASMCSAPGIHYCTFDHPQLTKLGAIVARVKSKEMNSGSLLDAVLTQCRRKRKGHRPTKLALFDGLLDSL